MLERLGLDGQENLVCRDVAAVCADAGDWNGGLDVANETLSDLPVR